MSSNSTVHFVRGMIIGSGLSLLGYMGYLTYPRGNETWVRPKNRRGYYPDSSSMAIAHPARSPYCDDNHKFPCPNKLCKGYYVDDEGKEI